MGNSASSGTNYGGSSSGLPVDDVLKVNGRTNINNPFHTDNTINTGVTFNPEKTNMDDRVILYSMPDLRGNTYAIANGSYTSTSFVDKLSPDNVFSLSIPPETSIKMFCGDIYDYGGKGGMEITNVTNERISVPSLPQNVQGNVRSLVISERKHTDLYTDRQALNTVTKTNLEYFGTTDSLISSKNSGTSNCVSDYVLWLVSIIVLTIVVSWYLKRD
ncbi:hypothetical protein YASMINEVIRUS_231 [Yasminevirus sp. GU-2018]|uniref:Uncharacterized protein n=1 Tax=Yasminevirus sp. GU-2018 TaxID=2420051 RepID=A0A5K0U780_9VIRU|nr:hypothetical protein YASMINEVIRUS_231 [Yasminevirus sp. GU-2018]